jgi:D-alanyl-D-alanine carboxypeptidase
MLSRMLFVGLLLAPTATVLRAGDSPEITATLDPMLSSAFPADGPGVAALVTQAGEVKLRKGYGLANVELRVPLDPSDVLPICSITKQFTAVAVLQLVQAGKLRLGDPLASYVPGLPASAGQVTLGQLLTHTSGIPSFEDTPEGMKQLRGDLTPDQVLAITIGRPLNFPPGSDWRYSNAGYLLLGKCIERASGQSYADYVRVHLFEAAGLDHTFVADESRVISNRVAFGYSRAARGIVDAPYHDIVQAYSAGCILTNVDDIWTWERSLEAGRLLDPALFRQATTEVILPDGRGANYGMGWQIDHLGPHATRGHGGGFWGFTSYELEVPDAGVFVALFANTDSPSVSLPILAGRLARAVLGESDARTVAALVHPEDYVGIYRISAEAAFTVSLEKGMLYGRLGPGRKRLKPTGPDEFSAADGEVQLKFARDTAARIVNVGFKTDGPGPVQIWPKVDGSE